MKLERNKEALRNEGKQLEAEERNCKKEEKKLREMIDDIQEKKEAKHAEMKKICNSIEDCEEKEKNTCIAKEKKALTNELENLAAKKGDIIREIGDLSVHETMYNTDLEEVANREKNYVNKKQSS